MKLRTKKLLLVLTIVTLLLSLLAVPALAAAGDDTAPAGDTAAAQTVEDEGNTIGFKALAVGLAIRSIWKSHKSGGCSCGGNCSSCGGCCHSAPPEDK